MKPEPLKDRLCKSCLCENCNRANNHPYFEPKNIKSAVEFYLRYKDISGSIRLKKEYPKIFKELIKWMESRKCDKDIEKWLINKAFEDVIK